ncbi:MAG: arylamine N-acetyltransferase [Vicinamibacterales bacterium]
MLRRLHAAHVAAIPFENLAILMGHGVSLVLDDLVDKLVVGRRGGYCSRTSASAERALRTR